MSNELLNPTAPMAASLPIPPAPKAATRAERAALRHSETQQRNSLGAANNPTNNYQKKKKGKSLKKEKEIIKLRPQSEKLYQDAQNRRVSLEKKRESLDIECTFAPKITRKGQMSSPPPTDENKRTSRSELLYQDAAKRKAHQEKLKSQLTPSFKPIMSKVSARTSERAIKKRKPLYQPNSMKQRDAEVEKIRQRLELEEQAKIEESLKTRNVWDVQRQQFTERSTFDLNDPNELKKRPKWSDDDVVGPASMRRFAGEDRHIGDRRKMQATQMKDWCAQMQAEKLQVKQRKDEEMLKHSQYLMDVDAVRNEMNKIELEQKMADNYKVAESNQQLAQMRQAERQQEVALQKQLNEMHNKTIENDPMIRESRDQAISTVPGRVRRDHWKGMTVSQLQSIQAENYENILVKKARQAVEAAEEVKKKWCWSFLSYLFFF